MLQEIGERERGQKEEKEREREERDITQSTLIYQVRINRLDKERLYVTGDWRKRKRTERGEREERERRKRYYTIYLDISSKD